MSFMNARSMYRKTEENRPIEATDPHEVIQVTLRELGRSLQVLSSAADQGRPYPDQHINRALTAIYILQSSLDFEQGGEIATNLFRVYEYCRLQVADAFARKPDAKLKLASDHIQSLLAAWEQIGSGNKAKVA